MLCSLDKDQKLVKMLRIVNATDLCMIHTFVIRSWQDSNFSLARRSRRQGALATIGRDDVDVLLSVLIFGFMVERMSRPKSVDTSLTDCCSCVLSFFRR